MVTVLGPKDKNYMKYPNDPDFGNYFRPHIFMVNFYFKEYIDLL